VLSHGLIIGDAVDQLIEALPAYLGGHPLWQPATMLGYPYAANPLSATWYPLDWLRYVPNSFDAYEIAAYVVAATGTFGLAYALTESLTGAIVAGIVYSFGGFMVSHAGHLSLIEPAAWVPWMFWSLALLRDDVTPRRVAFAGVALSLVAFAGQPQPLVYALYAGAAFVLFTARGARAGARNFIGGSAIALLFGAGLAAIILVPGIQLALASVRPEITYPEHVGFSTPISQLPLRLLFPYLFGETSLWPYTHSDFNVGSFAEMSNYVGVVTLALALIGATGRASLRFWVALFAVAALASASYDSGFGYLSYHLPGLAWFRAPGRHALEMTLAAAILAAGGIAQIEAHAVSARRLFWCLGSVGGLLFGVLLLFALFGTSLAPTLGEPSIVLDPVRNPALWIPAAIFAGGAVVVALVARAPTLPMRRLLVGVVAIDLFSFAWFAYWHEGAFPVSVAAPTEEAIAIRTALGPLHQRVLSFSDGNASDPIGPNLNILWRVPDARGYTMLELNRTAQFLPLHALAQERSLLEAGDHRLDAAAVRYLIFPPSYTAQRPANDPFDFGTALGFRVGGSALATLTIVLPRPVNATRLAIASSLFRGETVPEGTLVAQVVCSDDRGRTVSEELRSGSGPWRVDTLSLGNALVVRRVEIRRIGQPDRGGTLSIERLSLIDDRAGIAYPLNELAYVLGNDHWRRLPGLGTDQIFENTRALPRAWTVHQAISVSSADALKLTASKSFDPGKTAILEDARIPVEAGRQPDSVQIESLTPLRMTVHAACVTACILVTSDAWYPGWHAWIDGRSAAVFPVDYALRGVAVPAGTHSVEFRYLPVTTYIGATITILTVVLLLLMLRRPGVFSRLKPSPVSASTAKTAQPEG
jgi:hypothetical protein